jgi:superfamily II DNA or RNA helicase
MKGGVYVIWKEIDNIEDPSSTVVKIGRSKNIAQRFKSANTFVYNEEYKTKVENIQCIVHSPSYARNGTSILEGLIHSYYEKYRKPRTEYFKFPGKFDVGSDQPLLEFLKSKNITDVRIYRNILDVPETIPKRNSITDPSPSAISNPSTFEPRELQRKTLTKMNDYFAQHQKGCLFMPPGLGKTYLAGFYIVQHTQLHRVLVLVPQLLIATEFQTMFRNLKCSKKVITLSSQHDDIGSVKEYVRECSELIIITTYQTFAKHHTLFPTEYDFIVYDEAHHLPEASEYQKSLSINGCKLFMTATPKIIKIDKDSPNIQNMHEFSLDNVEQYGNAIDSMTIHSAIDQGSLCDYRLIIHQDQDPADYGCQLRDCVKPIVQLCEIYNRKRIVVYYNTRERAQQAKDRFDTFQRKLENSNYTTFYIDGEMNQHKKEEVLNEFTCIDAIDNTCNVIFNVNVLSEGVSLPCVDAVLLMDPKSSPILLTQICGRAMRIYPGKEEAVFCIPSNCVDTLNVLMQYIFYDIIKTSSKHSLDTEVGKRLITHGPTPTDETNLKKIVHRQVKLMEISRMRGKHALFHKWATEGILEGTSMLPEQIAKTLVQLNELTPQDVQYLKDMGRRTQLTDLERYHKARIRNVALKYYFREGYEEYGKTICTTLNTLFDRLHKCAICSSAVISYEPFVYNNKHYCSEKCKEQTLIIHARRTEELERMKRVREEQEDQTFETILKTLHYNEKLKKEWAQMINSSAKRAKQASKTSTTDNYLCKTCFF